MSTNHEVLSVLAGGIQHEFDRGYDALFVDAVGLSGAAPVAALVSPAGPGVEPNEPIVVDVTDADSSIRRTFLVLRVPATGLEEVVFQGDRFAANYSASSSRTPITDGHRYSLRRAGGWPGSPTIDVYAIDTTGEEA